MSEPTQHATIDTAPTERPKKKRRIFMWFFIAVQVLFLVWIFSAGASGAGQPSDCGTLSADTCNTASDIGTGIGVMLIIGVWIVADFLLALIYGVFRLAKRV